MVRLQASLLRPQVQSLVRELKIPQNARPKKKTHKTSNQTKGKTNKNPKRNNLEGYTVIFETINPKCPEFD